MKTVQYPQGHVLLRNLTKVYPVVSHGKRCVLFDHNGKSYLDAVGGAYVASVGHGNTWVVDKIANQLAQVAYVNGTQFTSEPTENLANRLIQRASSLKMDRAAFLCSGSEANEAAIKFCRQVCVDQGFKSKYKIIARRPGYHGNTLFSLSASARPAYQVAFGPMLSEVFFVSAPLGYRSPVSDYEKEGPDYYASELEALIQKEGPETICAFIAEPVIGSSGGGAIPPQNYFKKISEICKKYQILMIADEVLTGAGRTGNFFGCETVEWKPDVIVLGKGISGGYSPLSAVLVKDEHLSTIRDHTGHWMHAQTYLHSPSQTAAGWAVSQYFDEYDVISNVQKLQNNFQERLKKELSSFSFIGNVSGAGFLAGFEMVSDLNTKQPYQASLGVTQKLLSLAFDSGLILWPNQGHVDGKNGDLLMLAPPLNSTQDELNQIIDRLVEVLKKVQL